MYDICKRAELSGEPLATTREPDLRPFQKLQRQSAADIKRNPLEAATIVEKLEGDLRQTLDPEGNKKGHLLAEATVEHETQRYIRQTLVGALALHTYPMYCHLEKVLDEQPQAQQIASETVYIGHRERYYSGEEAQLMIASEREVEQIITGVLAVFTTDELEAMREAFRNTTVSLQEAAQQLLIIYLGEERWQALDDQTRRYPYQSTLSRKQKRLLGVLNLTNKLDKSYGSAVKAGTEQAVVAMADLQRNLSRAGCSEDELGPLMFAHLGKLGIGSLSHFWPMQELIEDHRTNPTHKPMFIVRRDNDDWLVAFADPYLARRYEANTPQGCIGAFTESDPDEITKQAFSRFVQKVKELAPHGEVDISEASAIRSSLASTALAATVARRDGYSLVS